MIRRPSRPMNSIGDTTGPDLAVRLAPDEVAAKMWDDYLRRFGPDVYVMARYISAPRVKPMTEDGLLPRSS